MISVAEAQQLVVTNAPLLSTEIVELERALGRTLAEEVLADRDYPPFNRAAMDGYAFRLAEYAPLQGLTIAGELFAGHVWEKEIAQGHCLKIMTGAPTPEGLDCIVPVEMASVSGPIVFFPNATLRPNQNMALKGEDRRKDERVFPTNLRLGPTEIATLAVLGKKQLAVRRLPRIAVLSTGDELVPVEEPVSFFQIRDSNAYALQAFFQQMSIPLAYREIVKDQPEALRSSFERVSDMDIVIVSGGVSMGDADYVPKTLGEMGVRKVFHKVQLRPGKPIWFGKNEKGTAYFGLPGNPLSCQVCFKLFIEPYVRQCFGLSPFQTALFPLLVDRKKKVKLDEYFPVKWENGGLIPLVFNGSGDIASTVGSTGIALHSSAEGDLQKGALVSYIHWA